MTGHALDDLKEHWGSAYLIWLPGDYYWYAQNRQTRVVLKAATAGELRLMIRADYDLKRTSGVPTPGGAPTS